MNGMDEQPVKIAKITIHVDYMDGSAIEAQAVEPHNMAVDVAYPEREVDITNTVVLTSRQPPPTITVSFTANRDHGWQERHISRAEMEDQRAPQAN
jgi:hypothetical protein